MNIFKEIYNSKTLIQLKQNSIFYLFIYFLKNFIFEDYTLKKILEGRGFWGGLDEKISRMWLGLEIVDSDLPSLIEVKLSLTNGSAVDKININKPFSFYLIAFILN